MGYDRELFFENYTKYKLRVGFVLNESAKTFCIYRIVNQYLMPATAPRSHKTIGSFDQWKGISAALHFPIKFSPLFIVIAGFVHGFGVKQTAIDHRVSDGVAVLNVLQRIPIQHN